MPERSEESIPDSMVTEEAESSGERSQEYEQSLQRELPDYLRDSAAFRERFGSMMEGMTPDEQEKAFQRAATKARGSISAQRIRERLKR